MKRDKKPPGVRKKPVWNREVPYFLRSVDREPCIEEEIEFPMNPRGVNPYDVLAAAKLSIMPQGVKVEDLPPDHDKENRFTAASARDLLGPDYDRVMNRPTPSRELIRSIPIEKIFPEFTSGSNSLGNVSEQHPVETICMDILPCSNSQDVKKDVVLQEEKIEALALVSLNSPVNTKSKGRKKAVDGYKSSPEVDRMVAESARMLRKHLRMAEEDDGYVSPEEVDRVIKAAFWKKKNLQHGGSESKSGSEGTSDSDRSAKSVCSGSDSSGKTHQGMVHNNTPKQPPQSTPPPSPPNPSPIVDLASPPDDIYLRGNVCDALSSLWDAASNAPGDSGESGLKSGVLWSALNALEPAIPSRANRKIMTRFGDHESCEIRPELTDTAKTSTNTTTKTTASPSSKVTVEKRTYRNTGRALSVKAGIVASRIKNNLPRLIGLLENAHNNRKWVQAVVLSIVDSGIGPGTRKLWLSSLEKIGVSKNGSLALIKSVERTLRLWVGIEDPVAETDAESVFPRGLVDSGREQLSCEEKMEAFVSTVVACGFCPLLVSKRVCAVCLFHELTGTTNEETTYKQGGTPMTNSDAQARYELGLTLTGVEGWLKACATLHNKEQHSKNGNIDRVDDIQGERSALVAHLKSMFWDSPPINAHDIFSPGVLETDAELHMNRVHYSDTENGANTYHSICGSQHQFLGKREDVGQIIADWSRQVANGQLHGPEGAWREPQDNLNPDTAMHNIQQLGRNLQWVGIGYNSEYNHGALSETDTGLKMVDAASHPDPTTPGILNPQRSNTISGYVSGAPVFGFLARSASSTRTDWRDLGMKVAFYEDLRHNDFVQPSGVEWAWAERSQAPVRHILPLNRAGVWHYDATFVSAQALAAAFRETNGSLRVGQGIHRTTWDLSDGVTRIIALPDSACPGDIGAAVWVLSHLTYPLAWVADCVRLYKGEGVRSEEAFVRTAGLVSMNDPTRRIVFVVPSQERDNVTLGGHLFPLGMTDRHGNPDERRPPLSYNADVMIENLIFSALTCKTSLRSAFSRYVEQMFDGGLNWLEIDSLATACIVRWQARVEAYYDDQGVQKGRGAPDDVLLNIYELEADDAGQVDTRLVDYGARVAVTCLDARVAPRSYADGNPHLIMGRWTNLAELTLATGVCRYRTFDTEDRSMVKARLDTGLHDRAIRGRYLRKTLECWKKDCGIQEEIAFPGTSPRIRTYWDRFILPPEGTVGLEGLFKEFITSTVKFSWNINLLRGSIAGGTLTGIRTTSSWWRNRINTEWGGISIGGTGRTVGTEYAYEDRSTSWAYSSWYQPGQGNVDQMIESALMRLNLHTHNWELTFRAHPNFEQRKGYAYLLECNTTGFLAYEAGWTKQRGGFDDSVFWGWGVGSMVREWETKDLKTIVIPNIVGVVIEATNYTRNTWLARGCAEGWAGPGIQRDYIGRPPAWTLESIQKRVISSFDGHPKVDGQIQSPDVPAQLRIEALKKELASLEAAMKDTERVDRNKNDQDGPIPSAEVKALGTTSSGQNVVSPTTAAVIAGKYSTTITGRVVPPPDPEPVVASAQIASEGEKQRKRHDQ